MRKTKCYFGKMVLDTIPLEKLNDSLFADKGVAVSILRLDSIHPVTGGNKWFKLKYNLQAFLKEKKDLLVTMGGAYSNHVIATAAAGKEKGIPTVGIIRGEELNENSNEDLKFASACGMKLFFVSREEYRRIRQTEVLPEQISSSLPSPLSNPFFLPEGGSNALAVKGCREILNFITEDFDYIICPVGTGATLAGISTGLNEHQSAIGIPVLEGKDFLEKNIYDLNGGRKNFKLMHEYTFGGYARTNEELEHFCKNFSLTNHIPAEPIYTGKMFFALYDLTRKNYFRSGSRIIAVHTGGIRN